MRPQSSSSRRLKLAAEIRPSGVDKHSVEGQQPVRLCNYTDVYKNERIVGSMDFMHATATNNEIERLQLRKDDVLITKDSEAPDDIGKPALVDASAAGLICGYHLALLRPRDGVSGSFLAWALRSQSVSEQFCLRAQGVTRFGLTTSAIGSILIPLPEEDRQLLRAAFLDHEIPKIDNLLTEQSRLLTLLKEERRALVAVAVTGGEPRRVGKEAPGLPWVRQAPSHWRRLRMKHLFRLVKRIGSQDTNVLSVYREFGVIEKASRSDNHNRTPDDLSSYQVVRRGDLVINKMKAWQGSLGVSPFDGITSPDYAVFEPLHEDYDDFIHYLLRAAFMPALYRAISNGIRIGQWRLEPEKFLRLPVALPNRDEQVEIVESIKCRFAVNDSISDEVLKLQALLLERRSALITAATIGEIDNQVVSLLQREAA